jgi:hypothetical protein
MGAPCPSPRSPRLIRQSGQGRRLSTTLEGARTGGFARTRDAVFKALAMLRDNP